MHSIYCGGRHHGTQSLLVVLFQMYVLIGLLSRHLQVEAHGLSNADISNEANLNHLEARIFVIFHVVGGVGNLAMLLTALLSKRVVRHPTWLSFCVTWIIWAISYTLL